MPTPYTENKNTNTFTGTVSVEHSCPGGSSAKGTFTTTLPMVIEGGRAEPGLRNYYRFDDPIRVSLNFTAELSYPNATAAMISLHVPFANTQGYTGPERGGNCPDGSYSSSTGFQGTTTKTASMNCTLSPVQGADNRNGVLEMRINTWTGCCALIPASGQQAPAPGIGFDAYAYYRIEQTTSITLNPTVVFPFAADDATVDIEVNGVAASITAAQFGALPPAQVVSSVAGKLMLRQRVPADTPPGRYELVVTEGSAVIPAGAKPGGTRFAGSGPTRAYLYVAGLEIFDPNPSLLRGTDPASAGAVTDPAAIAAKIAAGEARTARAVAADGVTQVLLRIPSDKKLRINVDSNGSGSPGMLRSLSGQEGASVEVAPVAVPDPKIGSAVYVIYQPPIEIFNKQNAGVYNPGLQDDFVKPAPDDPGTQRITLSVQIEAQGNNQAAPPQHRGLTLVRPPMVLIHGIWSSSDVWTQGKFDVEVQKRTGTRAVALADYRQASSSSFDPRQNNTPGIEALKFAIYQAMHEYRILKEIAATQVDVVAHSMGGMMTRIFSTKTQQYARPTNYFRGDVHKLITLDTPHTGSLFVVFLWNLRDEPVVKNFPVTEETEFEGVLKVIQEGTRDYTVADVASMYKMDVNGGGVESFLPCSASLKAVEASPIPTHAVAGIRPSAIAQNKLFKFLVWGLSAKFSFPSSIDELIDDPNHDTIVEAVSELGGLEYDASAAHDPYGYPAHYQPNVVHAYLTDEFGKLEDSVIGNPATQDVVAKLLRIAPDSGNTYGKLKAPRDLRTAEWGTTKWTGPCVPSPREVKRSTRAKSLDAETTSPYIQLTSPAIGAEFFAGDTVTLTAAAQNGLAPLDVTFAGNAIEPTQLAPGALEATVAIPENFVGRARFFVWARDSAGAAYQGITEILVRPKGTMASLKARPAAVRLSYVSETTRVFVDGVYADGLLLSVSDLPEVQYTTSDAKVATVSPRGQVQAVGAGTATITISLGDSSVQVPVMVGITNAPPKITPVSPFTVAAGSTRTVPLSATSPFGNQITLTAQSVPAFATLATDSGGGSLILNPKSTDIGNYSVTIIAQDNGNPPLLSTLAIPFTVGREAQGTPRLGLTPSTLDFGGVAVGQSKDLTLTVNNTGTAALVLSGLSISGNSFSLVNPQPPVTIPDGGSIVVTLRFRPSSPGAVTGSLTIAANDPSRPSATVPLSGSGTPVANPAIEVSSTFMDFGSVGAGLTKDLTLTVRNTGNAALTVNSATSSNPRFAIVNASAPFTVAAGSSQAVGVRFSPTAAGTQTGTLTLASNDPVRPSVVVNLTGTAAVTSGSETRVVSVDDGSFEISGGVPAGAPTIYFVNRLTPSTYPATLKNIQIIFLNQANALKPGDSIRVLVGTNPGGSATIDNIRLLAASTSVGTTGTFNSYETPATTIQSGDFVVGFTTANPPNIFPGAIDSTPPSRQRSYVSFDGVTFQQLDTIQGLAGNLGIRATVELGAGTSLPAGGGEAYWKFDEGSGTVASDSTGKGNTGNLLNGATWIGGVSGTALSLDGVDDYVNAGSSLNMQSTTFTIEAWIKGDPSMEGFGRIVDSGFASGFALGRNGGGKQALFEFRGSPYLVSNTEVIDNTWHHVVVVKSGATATMYADGVLQGSVAVNAGPPVSTLPLFIGYNPGEGTRGHWKGQIDELRIYSRALTAAEIQTNFNALKPAGGTTGPGRGSSTPNAQAYWRFEEGSGTVASDATGHNYTGTLQGGAGWTAGVRGTAVNLDGVDDYVSVGNSFRLTSPNFTLDAWIKADPSMEAFGRILDSGYATGFALGRNGGGRQVLFEFRGSPYLISTTEAIDNTWHHVAVVKSGGTATIYIDGAAQGSVAVNAEAPTNTLPLFIGYNPGEGTRGHWKGQLDEVRIYDRALSAAEVQANYTARGQ